ncbi:Neutral/alkaline nonlysosomal ceramidase [Hygrophoropsis aurantiaca]|uniref:Neutral/alkaline nonlysosomal ceramidase n=1 Tax=Hygrophoropsis aurantiaca TaxID=72124 RepID=A0ACB8ASD4_9AGAM|nr:Neutral/alkaline nonlysosomal ceramidase [Hygrophoropsis aurantiaca]
MYLLAYDGGTSLPLGNIIHCFLDALRSLFFYLTAFLASSSLWSHGVHTGTTAEAAQTQYLLGLGIGDVTGPVVETNMMGYASLAQTDTGLHMRQRSRAFVIADPKNPTNRVVFINSDICMGDTGIRRAIVTSLSSLYPGLYTDSNIALVGTHSHAGVGGYLENLLPQLTAFGYVNATASAIIQGTVRAVQQAHDSLAIGTLSVGNSTVLNANINRSPSAYLANPEEERARYEYDHDKDLTVLRFNDNKGNARGLLSFFAVHGTSLYENNTLVSGDNKGMAAYLYESYMEPSSMPGHTKFVAAFAQSNVGDTSPNTLGAFCESPGKPYDGQPCDFKHSTCGNKTQDCHGRGPGFRISDFESNRLIGLAQFSGAQKVMEGSMSPVNGGVRSVHTYLNMANHTFTLLNGTTAQTCPPALGYSFAGGTTDGPGAFDFIQGDNSSNPQNPFWEIVKGAVTPAPPPEQAACHEPKPILLNTGYAHSPYEWSPSTVDIQMFRVGNFVMLIMPGELTTMAGRRMREAIRAKLISSEVLGEDAYVVVAGPANVYAHYVTTREEYGVQRYEGASTIYGAATLEAYIDMYGGLIPYLAVDAKGSPASDPPPPEQISKAISMQKGVIADNAGLFKKFGDVLSDVSGSTYHAGDVVHVQFVGANPRNNLRLEGTFLTVDQLVSGDWKTFRTDSHPSTVYRWNRTSTVLGTSTVDITWTIEEGTPAGTYRIVYHGDSKPLIGSISPFIGISSTFTVG